MSKMNNREASIEFVRAFYTGDVAALAPLLAEDLRFSGPFYKFGSAEACMQVLRGWAPGAELIPGDKCP